jgi:predicted AlkP superfamily pyrophosphatase or phosphodiesterase
MLPLYLVLYIGGNFVFADEKTAAPARPKLIVGIVVDQMRYDYLTRYWDKFGNDGFKKLVTGGANCINTHFNYIPTYTGPGHASIYTGTTPSVHGIISNAWHDRNYGRNVYVTEDSTVTGVGGGTAGKMSPKFMMVTSVADELRLASNMKSKVIGISLKDRGAILPAGHSANAAYWYEGSTGNWITSTFYMKTLPGWVTDFNALQRPAAMLKTPWTTLLPIEQYSESTADSTAYEEPFAGETAPVFPHFVSSNPATDFELVKRSPYGNTLTSEFALAALKAESLGKDAFTDLLAVSFSSTDYVGHQFGTFAVETQDTYLRLDRDLAHFIREIETWCGKENVLFFLTADHGAVPNPQFLKDRRIPAGHFNSATLKDSLEKFLTARYGSGPFITTVDNDQVYLNKNSLVAKNINEADVQQVITDFLITYPGITRALTRQQLASECQVGGLEQFMKNGFCPSRSGDVGYMLSPGLIEWSGKGTTHGSAYTYDTHVPLLFYGAGIRKGVIEKKAHITDIAPTIALLMGIQPPSGCTGSVIEGLIEHP